MAAEVQKKYLNFVQDVTFLAKKKLLLRGGTRVIDIVGSLLSVIFFLDITISSELPLFLMMDILYDVSRTGVLSRPHNFCNICLCS